MICDLICDLLCNIICDLIKESLFDFTIISTYYFWFLSKRIGSDRCIFRSSIPDLLHFTALLHFIIRIGQTKIFVKWNFTNLDFTNRVPRQIPTLQPDSLTKLEVVHFYVRCANEQCSKLKVILPHISSRGKIGISYKSSATILK